MNLLGWECYTCHSQYRNGKNSECPEKCAKCLETIFIRVYDNSVEGMYDGRAEEEAFLDSFANEWDYMGYPAGFQQGDD